MFVHQPHRLTLRLSAADHRRETPPGATSGIHFAEALVEHVVAEFTRPGDRVLDPFAGYGTTVVVAARMGRPAVGLELQPHRVEYASGILGDDPAGRMLCADARDLATIEIGAFDLCLTSPPYMTLGHHPENPLDAYRTDGGDYGSYLRGLREIFAEVGARMRPGGHVVVNVGTLRTDQGITPLARDLRRELATLFDHRGDIRLDWDERSTFVMSDYCLVFRAGSGDQR